MTRNIRRRFHQLSISNTWDLIRTSFWFTPLVMTIIAILLTRIFLYIDAQIPNEVLDSRKLILSGTTADVRSILVQMAVTTLATAGVVFSLLTVPLSTVASQYGSRLLRLYRRDRTTQFVLGMFAGTFLYCLMAAFELPPPDQVYDLPQLTATFALVLFIITFATLIALIQHITTALQAPSVIAAAGGELSSVVRSLISETEDREKNLQVIGVFQNGFTEVESFLIQSNRMGYIQSIDLEGMLKLAKEADIMIQIVQQSGDFVSAKEVIAKVWPADSVNQQLTGRLRHFFLIGRQRTPTQDFVYAVNQLVEIALRAMSPAINDPFSAMTCIDYIGANLAQIVVKEPSPSQIADSNGHIRVIFEPVTFKEMLVTAFDMLRHASCDNATVLLKILDTFEDIGRKTEQAEYHQELLRQVSLVREESLKGNLIGSDQEVISQRCDYLIRYFEKDGYTQNVNPSH